MITLPAGARCSTALARCCSLTPPSSQCPSGLRHVGCGPPESPPADRARAPTGDCFRPAAAAALSVRDPARFVYSTPPRAGHTLFLLPVAVFGHRRGSSRRCFARYFPHAPACCLVAMRPVAQLPLGGPPLAGSPV